MHEGIVQGTRALTEALEIKPPTTLMAVLRRFAVAASLTRQARNGWTWSVL